MNEHPEGTALSDAIAAGIELMSCKQIFRSGRPAVAFLKDKDGNRKILIHPDCDEFEVLAEIRKMLNDGF